MIPEAWIFYPLRGYGGNTASNGQTIKETRLILKENQR
ncbi:Uncharacterised protein [Streptococcus merionis]|uniref:Uncharacterized protein n=1 Tax=Streptococcus merionis TaxID=400065 RepID=A0A239SMX0_9STRE|nr:Uncharacterised protein [Streptococcus merionis]